MTGSMFGILAVIFMYFLQLLGISSEDIINCGENSLGNNK